MPSKEFYLGYTSSVRKYDFEISQYYGLDKNKNLIDSHIHLEFVKNPKNNDLKNSLAQKIITNKSVGIISHFNVKPFLKNTIQMLLNNLAFPKEMQVCLIK